MPIRERLSPGTKAAIVLIVAVILLATPVIGIVLDDGGPAHKYERAEVVATGSGIGYVDDDLQPSKLPFSEQIDCQGVFQFSRICFVEEYIAKNEPVPTQWASSGANSTAFLSSDAPYVQIDETLYRRIYPRNTSVQRDNNTYRVEMDLEPADPERVLDEIAVDVDRVPPVVAEAAREGQATSADGVDLPSGPVATADGSYYRVYQSNPEETSDEPEALLNIGPRLPSPIWLFPVGGIALLNWLWARTEIAFDL